MSNADILLPGLLSIAVPLWIERLRQYTPEERRLISQHDGEFVAAHGDNVLYRGHRPGDSAEAFNRVARGLAVGAYQPGGVTAFGQHWCTDHAECEGAEQATASADREPARRATQDVHLPAPPSQGDLFATEEAS